MNPANIPFPQQQSTQPQMPFPQAQANQGRQPNFLEKLLPTAGGILGGLVTAPLELAPGLGTALNIGGAAAGGAFGKFLENKLTGHAGGNDVLASGAEGAIGQGTGSLLGGIFKGGMGLLGRAADSGATKMIQGQFNRGTLDNETAAILNKMGITNADQIGQISPHITGTNGALSNGVRRGLTETNSGVDLSGLGQHGQNLVAENQMQLKPNSIKDISNTIQSALLKATHPDDVIQMASKGSGAPVTTFSPGALQNILPENAFGVAKSFEDLAASAYKSAFDKAGNVVNPDQAAKFNIFRGLANETKGTAFGGANPLPLSPENKAQIIAELSPLKDVNPQAYNHIIEQVSGAQNLQDLRPIQKPMVDASKALNATQRIADVNGGLTAGGAAKTVLPLAGSVAGGAPGMLGGLALSALGTKTADKIGASTLSRVSDVLTNPTIQKLVKTSTPVATQTLTNAPNYAPQATDMTGGTAMMPNQQPGANPYATAGGMPQTMSPSLLGMQTGLIGLQDPYLAQSYAPLVNSAIPQLQKAAAAQAALQGLEQTFQQAGGGQGLFGGLLSRLGGALTGGPTQLYGQQSDELSKQLAGMGIPISSTPQVTNTPGASQSGFSTIQNIINALGGGQSVLSGLPA